MPVCWWLPQRKSLLHCDRNLNMCLAGGEVGLQTPASPAGRRVRGTHFWPLWGGGGVYFWGGFLKGRELTLLPFSLPASLGCRPLGRNSSSHLGPWSDLEVIQEATLRGQQSRKIVAWGPWWFHGVTLSDLDHLSQDFFMWENRSLCANQCYF